MGPYATQMLGDMGADVIKVESPEGDAFRSMAPSRNPLMGAAFLNLNRNKRSIVMDLAREDERDTLLRLLDTADVFISNLRPRSLRKLNLDYDRVRERCPRLVYCGVYGFSERGPYAGRPAFDDIIQAMSGLASVQGYHHGQPEYVNSIVADKIVGMAAVWAILAALLERERSGIGQAIEVPMFELMVSFNLVEHLAGATFQSGTEGAGYERVLAPDRRPYRTKDGYISLLPYTTAQWQRFFRLAGRPEYVDDRELTDPPTRSRTIRRWYAILSDLVAERSTSEWIELLKDADIPIAPVTCLDDILNDEHLQAVGMISQDVHVTEGEIRTVGIPVTFSRTPGSIRRLAPRLNEHREEILRELDASSPIKAPGPRRTEAIECAKELKDS
jgi:crotonobetainyl-CoA:carnitine CoA-transferase CaiB-like acyl-CoA transferase